ncbi:Uncharacterized protein Rs2_39233 [Raphanus sativus]|nr:Uncharacterized protein Rs2_39233 [Raphanus sativus]
MVGSWNWTERSDREGLLWRIKSGRKEGGIYFVSNRDCDGSRKGNFQQNRVGDFGGGLVSGFNHYYDTIDRISRDFYSSVSKLSLFQNSFANKALVVSNGTWSIGGIYGGYKEWRGNRKRLKIAVAHFDNSDLIRSCSKILVGRCMNPPAQEMKALLSNLPKIWKLEDRVIGKDLGLGKFQFEFEKEEDIEGVLKLQPYHFDFWMFALAKWQPKRSINYPYEIPFWVRVLGVSKEFRTVSTFESIGEAIGRVVEVDLELMRVLVVVDGFKELCFETSQGVNFMMEKGFRYLLRYEKLFGYGSLCHQEVKCPLLKGFKHQSERKMETREGIKHDDRARSYKGVVINGTANQHNREREAREYYGKGKGKMVEDADSKWVRVADRGNRRPSENRGNNRGDGEESEAKELPAGKIQE